MFVIAVSGDSHSGGEAFASVLARRFDLLCLSPALLVDSAVARNADHDALRTAIEGSPSLWSRLQGNGNVCVQVLRKALGKQIRDRSMVCYGAVTDLLPVEAPEVLRIQVQASYSARLRAVQNTQRLDEDQARRYLKRSDCRQRRWQTLAYGPGEAQRPAVDLAVCLEEIGMSKACQMVEAKVTQRMAGRTEPSVALQDFTRTELDATRLSATALPGRTHRCFRPAFALPGIGALALLSLVLIAAAERQQLGRRQAATLPVSFTGVVTDTLCAGSQHILQRSDDCVRACTQRPGVQYALYSGTATYITNDQTALAKLAAQLVAVKGTIDKNTGMLELDSIQAQ